MKKGKCPKCRSSDIYSGANIKLKTGAYNSNTIPLGGLFGSHIALDNYVCASCGYVESYINNPKDIEKVKTRWGRIW